MLTGKIRGTFQGKDEREKQRESSKKKKGSIGLIPSTLATANDAFKKY